MSIGALAVAEAAVAAQPQQAKSKPPKTRQVIAKTDPVASPEAR